MPARAGTGPRRAFDGRPSSPVRYLDPGTADGYLTLSAISAHFQLYSDAVSAPVRWRLLSGNNRDMGRAAEEYPDDASCRDAIADLRSMIGGLQVVLKPVPPVQWAWVLRQPTGRVLATSGYSYDRQLRCEQGRSRVRAQRG